MLSAPGCVGVAPVSAMISRDCSGLSMSMQGMSRLWLNGWRLDLAEIRRVERLQEAHIADVVGGEVSEDARLDPALARDVRVVPAGDAALDPGGVAPEVDREDRLHVAHAVNGDAELVALLRREHHRGARVATYRHVEEVPADHGALLDERVDELVADEDPPVV